MRRAVSRVTATSAVGPLRHFWIARTMVVIGIEADIQPTTLTKSDI